MADNNIDVFKMFAAEDRLDGDNYPMWAYMMQHVLVSKGVWNIVQGIDVRPGTVEVAEVVDVAGPSIRTAAASTCCSCFIPSPFRQLFTSSASFTMADNNIDVFKMFAVEDRLDGDNYPMWAYMMQHVLVSKGVWNIVQGIDVRPGTVDVAEVVDVAAKSAKQAWDILAGLYACRNEAKIALLRKELESKIMNEEDDMDTFLASIKYINEQLISAGEIISDSSLVQTVLDALPDSYQTFTSTWRLMTQRNPDVVKFDEVCTLLLQEALSRKNRSRQRAVEQAFIVAQ
ncbi:hypothetical protein L7F22_057213 [Adiantum nelumboides]|nr:hypothetical protein [Adiantum nelumboides]